jgi:catechol 2,3-dioxygenase-like lactoylglutathione lyase family enzyme
MTLGHIELFVNDPMRSIEFYSKALGMDVTATQKSQFVWLRMGEIEILLRPGTNPPHAPDYQHTAVALVFYTDDLINTANLLRSRGVQFFVSDGSEKCLTFSDPDGNWFQLLNPLDM